MRILGIDMSAMFRRHYEATERDGAEARKRTIAEVMAEREGFDRVALCLDGGRSFRAVVEPAYKAQRERPPAAYGEQLRRAIDRLVLDGCVAIEAPQIDMSHAGGPAEGYYAEGDDVLAALAQWCTDNGHALRILGGDKDLLQLVDDEHGVEVKRPEAPAPLLDGETEPAPAWRAAHVERFHKAKEDGKDVLIGVTPARIADVLALAGDGSDNYAAFHGWTEPSPNGGRPTRKPGIGMTTAIRLVQKFGTAIGVIDALGMTGDDGPLVKGHVGEVLRRGAPTPVAAVHRGLNLATLHRTLKIDFAPLLVAPVVKPVVESGGMDDAAPSGFESEPATDPPNAPRAIVAAPAPEPERPRPSTALARVEAQPMIVGVDRFAFQPRDLSQLWRTSQAFFNSRLYPQYGNPEAIMVIAIEAAERGIPIGLALRNAYVVKGRPAWSAAFLAALVIASGKAEVFEIVESTKTKAVLAHKRVGRPERTFEYTIEEAREAGWLRSGEKGDSKWLTNPRTMLRWAAMREGARAFFQEVVAGMHTPDELRGGHVTDDEIDADDTEPKGRAA